MTGHEAVGYSLLQTSAVTSLLASSTGSVWYGLRPLDDNLPCINYYEIAGGQRWNGMEQQRFSINCRAEKPADAKAIARAVLDLFVASNGSGIYGTMNNFDVARASLANDGGLIPEPEDRCYNAPVDIYLVYAATTVS
jgi:hypothetical protein